MCLGKLIGDQNHCIFHCTNDKLVDIRIGFVKELYENFESCFSEAAFTELTRIILKGTYRIKLDRTGKFL